MVHAEVLDTSVPVCPVLFEVTVLFSVCMINYGTLKLMSKLINSELSETAFSFYSYNKLLF